MGSLPRPLRPLADDPAAAAIFLDFDGTLAPIVDDPRSARPLPGAVSLLNRLASGLGLVAVVSGRPVSFLTGVLDPSGPVHLFGLYGMEERPPGGLPRTAPGTEEWRDAVAVAGDEARRQAPPGAWVEDKGLTVTVHWRRGPSAEAWARAFAARTAERTGLVVQPGRMAVELRPPVAGDKGVVVDRWGRGHRAVACFGDDVGDLPAFAALDRLAALGAAVARVAVVDGETPPEVAAAADVVVEGPGEALDLLGRLADEAGV